MGEVIRNDIVINNTVRVRQDVSPPAVYLPRMETLVANVPKRLVYGQSSREDVLIGFENPGPVVFGFGYYPGLTPPGQTLPLPAWDGETMNYMQFTDPHSQLEIWAVSPLDAVAYITESMRAA